MTITCHREGDCFYPDFFLPAEDPEALGKYGMLRKRFLKEHRPSLYAACLPDGRLTHLLAETDNAANEAFSRLADRMAKAEGVTEEMKAADQMLWVQRMNSIHARAEEILLSEYVYCQRNGSGRSLIGPSAAFCCPAMTY